MNKDECTVNIKWPWTMIPLDCADDWIDAIKSRIGPGHPLWRKEIFPSMRRDDRWHLVLVENDTDGTYALLDLEKKRRYRGKLMPAATAIATTYELQNMIERDH